MLTHVKPARHAPVLLGSDLLAQLEGSLDPDPQEAATRAAASAKIANFERCRAAAGAHDLRYHRLIGKFIMEYWNPVSEPHSDHPYLRGVPETAQALGIPIQQAQTSLKLFVLYDDVEFEQLIAMGLSYPVLELLLQIENPTDRDAALQALQEKKYGPEELALYVKRRAAQKKREFNKKQKTRDREQFRPSSPHFVRHMGENTVDLCRGTLCLVESLAGTLDNVVGQVAKFRRELVHVSYEDRVEVCRDIVAGLESVYAAQFIMGGFIELVTKRIPPPAPKQIEIAPVDQPPYARLHEVWDYLLMDGELLALTDASVRGIGVASKSGKDLQCRALEMVAHIRKLKGRLEWAENLRDDGGVPPIVEVRANIFKGLRWACEAMTAIPPKLNYVMDAVLPEGSGSQQKVSGK